MTGLESQLNAYIAIDKYSGLTDEHISDIMAVAGADKPRDIFNRTLAVPYAEY